MSQKDTICAIATAQGGAIGMIRVSGPDAITITNKIFTPIREGKDLSQQKAYTLSFGKIINEEEIIDEVLVSVFKAPHSYTGENSTEIACHGSSYILQQIVQLLIKKGARLAQPGEYTQRAFLNGKMDLSQAEAVADLIASSSRATHRIAMNQMRGGFSQELKSLRDKLLHFTSMIELELDFGEEDVEFANREELNALTVDIEKAIGKLVDSFNVGNAIKNGVPVAIIGETNAGKSTLLNTLLNEEKAIVSNIHGTTRDVIEDTVNINGTTFRFIDTAGIRDTTDEIETLGIKRTFEKLQQAEIIIWMVDAVNEHNSFEELAHDIIPKCQGKQLIVAFNKIDLISDERKSFFSNCISEFKSKYTNVSDIQDIFISAKKHINVELLQKRLAEAANIPQISQNDVIVSNVRHYEALSKALEAITRVKEGLDMNLPGDLVSQDIRECIFYLSDIAGEVTNDMVLQNIFKHFCIGK